jgi:hypothetical protein
MDRFDFADAGIIIGLIGIGFGIVATLMTRRIDELDRIIAEKEAVLNAPDQPAATPTATPR